MTTFTCKSFSNLTLQELYDILALRQEVFVVEQDCPYLDADGKDQSAWHLMGFTADDKLIAYTRLIPKGVSYKDYPSIGRVVTSLLVRRSGIGRELMLQSLEWMDKLFPQENIKISAQCYLENFYVSLGFKVVGESYLEDGIPHYPMVRKA